MANTASRLGAELSELVTEWLEQSGEKLAEWENEASHDGHEMRGEGFAYSAAAEALQAVLDRHRSEL